MAKQSIVKRAVNKLKANNERTARYKFIEELFYDFHRSRAQVYKMNFVRGLFFGFGSVLGGTLLVAIAIWLLSQFGNLPGVGNFFEQLTEAISRPSE